MTKTDQPASPVEGTKPEPIDLSERAEFDGSFVCPRCQIASEEEYYGPCANCCNELRATQGGAARDVEAAAYEPKMNVTPNAVASKE